MYVVKRARWAVASSAISNQLIESAHMGGRVRRYR
jgi:hypothetical protein